MSVTCVLYTSNLSFSLFMHPRETGHRQQGRRLRGIRLRSRAQGRTHFHQQPVTECCEERRQDGEDVVVGQEGQAGGLYTEESARGECIQFYVFVRYSMRLFEID